MFKTFNEVLAEKWQAFEEGETIWNHVIGWLEKQYDLTKTYARSGHLPPNNPLLWSPDFNINIPLKDIFKDKPELLKQIQYNRGTKQLSLGLSMGPMSISALHAVRGPSNQVDMIIQLGTSQDEEESERRAENLRKYLLIQSLRNGPIDLSHFLFTDHDMANIKTSLLQRAFSHEFTHFRDMRQFIKKSGIAAYKAAAEKQKKGEKLHPVKTAAQQKDRYYNTPTEVNAHSNEILRTVDQLGMLPHMKTATDFRKLAVHMMPRAHGFDKQRWIQYNQFFKTIKEKNLKKFMRRLHQYVQVKGYNRGGDQVKTHRRKLPKEKQ